MRFFSFLGSSFRVAPSTPWVVELELYGIICGTMEDREWVPVWDSFVLPWVTGSLFLCFLSRFPHFPPNDHLSIHVYLLWIAMICWICFGPADSQLDPSQRPWPRGARPDVCRRIRWSLDRFGLTAASLVAEKLIRRLSLDSDSWNRRWSGEAKAQGLTESLSQVSESSPWNSQLTQGLKRVR